MVTIPPTIPVTTPVADMVARKAWLLLHVPPAIELVSVMGLPIQTSLAPVIFTCGIVSTATIPVLRHPVGNTYVIREVPKVRPFTIPELLPIDATLLVPLLHVPPEGADESVEDAPMHIPVVPDIAAGKPLIVRMVVERHPVDSVYEIMAVPATTPVAMPDDVIVAADTLLLQNPPGVVQDSVVRLPTHTVAVPVMLAGNGFTVTIVDVVQPVGSV
jgi:hypothetical protein